MKSIKNIALIYSRLSLYDARLEYMPFGLNVVRGLDEQNYKIYLFLTERKNKSYDRLFSENVKIIFADNRYLWKLISYFRKTRFHLFEYLFITCYFNYLLLRTQKKYDIVFGIGIIGSTIARKLHQKKNIPFYHMNDEFPEAYPNIIWRNEEKKSAKYAECIILPDESRVSELNRQINNIADKNYVILPNGPFIKDGSLFLDIDWHERLGISKEMKILLYAGGADYYNKLDEILLTLPKWPLDTVLYIIAAESAKSKYAHLFFQNRVLWTSQKLSDQEFYSLINTVSICLALYRTDVGGLEFTGKSSGKIMRSIACGTPVIAPHVESFSFIAEYVFGELVTHSAFIPDAIMKILNNLETYRYNCRKNYREVSFDKYWELFLDKIQN